MLPRRHSGSRYSEDQQQHRNSYYGRGENQNSSLYGREDRRYEGYGGPPQSYYNRRQNYEESYDYEMDEYSNSALIDDTSPYRREYTDRDHPRKPWLGQTSDHHSRSLIPPIRDRDARRYEGAEE